MLVEPGDLPASAVLAAVRAGWDERVAWAEHAPVGNGGHHWLAGHDGAGEPCWFVTAVRRDRDGPGDGPADAPARDTVLAAVRTLAGRLTFVVGPVPALDGALAVPLDGYLLSVAPYVDGRTVPLYDDDLSRAEVAAALARLHAAPRPHGIPVWRPRIGWRGTERRMELSTALAGADWSAGPLGPQAHALVVRHDEVLAAALRRFDLLAAAVTGSAAAWVPTHGEPHAGNVISTAAGPRLVDWDSLALAPRERDLRHVLPGADGPDPELAYLANGGEVSALAPDVLELFALEWHLAEVARAALRLAGPHDGSPDDERLLADLAAELAALATRSPG